MNFKIGDICVYQNLKKHPDMEGIECVVTKPLRIRRGPTSNQLRLSYGTRNAVHGDGWTTLVEPHQLRKIEPPSNYDGNQLGEWDLVPWRPAKERVT